ncbi:amino acid transporter [Histoplasma capsulatum var. duboisii H88]|uniref:Amino acid transporter n=1 Tax=Ajellomyces capsulatus (strain H88) TaxID=544711 RepID=F0UD45_AJEC8|nr:amino acid transporter [Histoplasma capsulatum var. duboisii H88]QSS49649.1 amino acid transporter arg-13 [Histoplasma capsulatum var. duboisii H88]
MDTVKPQIPGAIENQMAVELTDFPTTTNHGVEVLKDIIYGSIAGIAGKFIEYPFDTVKVRLQSQPAGLPLLYKGPIDCFRKSFQATGINGLYRGISAPLVGAALETSSLFFSYRVTQDLLKATLCAPESSDGDSAAAGELPQSALLLCGAASGAFTSLLLTPVELIKCKMQVPPESGAASSSSGSLVSNKKAPGPISLIVAVFRHEGLLGFWRGQMGTLIRETGGSAAWFGSYEGVLAFFKKHNASKSSAATPTVSTTTSIKTSSSTGGTVTGAGSGIDVAGSEPLVHQRLLAGAAAGISYNFIFYPADTIKSRMQTENFTHAVGGDRASSSRPTFWAVGRALWKQQGLAGLYRGCGITCARSAPSSAFIFTIYEALRRYL